MDFLFNYSSSHHKIRKRLKEGRISSVPIRCSVFSLFLRGLNLTFYCNGLYLSRFLQIQDSKAVVRPECRSDFQEVSMSENAWQSDKKFLKTVADLSCLSPSKTDSINTFTNDAEILYTTLFSIFKFSSMKDRIRKEAYNELRKFAKSAQIATFRQRDLRRKVHLSSDRKFI